MSYWDSYHFGQRDVFAWLAHVDRDDAPLAPIGESTHGRAWAWCLAHNLAIGAGMCASFEMGRDAGPGPHIPFKTCWWRPGCGKPWTWPHITREDGKP